MNLEFVALLDLLALVQGVLLGILLMTKWRRHISYLFLGIFLFAYSSELSVSILVDVGYLEQHLQLFYLPTSFYFLFMPALHIYVISLTRPLNWQRRKWQFLPALVEFLMLVILFLQSLAAKENQMENGFMQLFYTIYSTSAVIYCLFYIVIVLREIKHHRHAIENHYSNSNGRLLHWVKWVCYFLTVILIFYLQQSFTPTGIINNDYTYLFFSTINVIFIFWVALSGIQQKITPLEITNDSGSMLITKQIDDQKSDPTVDGIAAQAKLQSIIEHIETEQIYTQSDLTLANLARQLQIPQRHLSEIINRHGRMNFKQFINQFRVNAAKRLLTNPDFAHYNMLGIAYEVGFNSKATFYSVFKQATKSTPLQFQKQALLS